MRNLIMSAAIPPARSELPAGVFRLSRGDWSGLRP